MKAITGKRLEVNRDFGVTIYRDDDGPIESLNSFSVDWNDLLVEIYRGTSDEHAVGVLKEHSNAVRILEIEKLAEIQEWPAFLDEMLPLMGAGMDHPDYRRPTKFDLYWFFGPQLFDIAASVTTDEARSRTVRCDMLKGVYREKSFTDDMLNWGENYRLLQTTASPTMRGPLAPSPREFIPLQVRIPAPSTDVAGKTVKEIMSELNVSQETAERLRNISNLVRDMEASVTKMGPTQIATHKNLKTQLTSALRTIHQQGGDGRNGNGRDEKTSIIRTLKEMYPEATP